MGTLDRKLLSGRARPDRPLSAGPSQGLIAALAVSVAGSALAAIFLWLASAERKIPEPPAFYNVVVGGRTLRVPAQVLGRPLRGGEQIPNIGFCVSWPDGALTTCQGSERSDRYDVVIHAIVAGRNAEPSVTAQQIISNRGLIRARMEESGLERFNVPRNNLEEYFLGPNVFGVEVLYVCDGEPNAIGRQGCKVANKNYVREDFGLSLFYYFSRKVLPDWRQIDATLWNTVEGWEVGARR
jgi:hypothetical protein